MKAGSKAIRITSPAVVSVASRSGTYEIEWVARDQCE